MKRDKNVLVTSVAASVTGRVDRVIRREYDEYDRVGEAGLTPVNMSQ